MTIRHGLIVTAAVLCATTAFAQQNQKATTAPKAATAKSASFKDLDKDGNGYIDSKEANAATGLGAMLPSLDTNKDGKLSAAEYAKHSEHK
jgi:hypothetical protein